MRDGSGELVVCCLSGQCASAFRVVRDVCGLGVLPAVTQHACLWLKFRWKSVNVCKQ